MHSSGTHTIKPTSRSTDVHPRDLPRVLDTDFDRFIGITVVGLASRHEYDCFGLAGLFLRELLTQLLGGLPPPSPELAQAHRHEKDNRPRQTRSVCGGRRSMLRGACHP